MCSGFCFKHAYVGCAVEKGLLLFDKEFSYRLAVCCAQKSFALKAA